VTDINADDFVSSSHRPMGFPEFVLVIASIMALNPLAMDMMLPALPNIASAFTSRSPTGHRRCCRRS
jgi:DHA1 family bicyclomycin/chloramphenicol resistance-like MFS transporter